MIDLKKFIEETNERLMKEAGFTKQIPQKEKKEHTPITGTITFVKNSKPSQKKKEQE